MNILLAGDKVLYGLRNHVHQKHMVNKRNLEALASYVEYMKSKTDLF